MRSLYDGMVRIVVTPTWAKLIDFETTLPSAVEELVRQRDERQRACCAYGPHCGDGGQHLSPAGGHATGH